MDWVVLILVLMILLEGLAIVVIGFRLASLWGRYDQFRMETGEVIAGFYERLNDANFRLGRLGYPEGRLSPSHNFIPDAQIAPEVGRPRT